MDQKSFCKFSFDLQTVRNSLKSKSFAGVTLTFSKKEIQKGNNFELPLNVLDFISKHTDLNWCQFGPELLELGHIARVEDLDHFI
jgi:hypothetical protein